MTRIVKVKVCGLTRPEDAREAVRLGACFGGVIGHEGSPRFVAPGRESPILEELPEKGRVWVAVEPSVEAVASALQRGFAIAQIHFNPESEYDPAPFAREFGSERVWLAPRLADPMDFREEWKDSAGLFLIDGFAPDRMGGTGQRVNGESFRRLSQNFSDKTFGIAGGISPENVKEVLQESHAGQLDVNSGVEVSPGIKDYERLRDLFAKVAEFSQKV